MSESLTPVVTAALQRENPWLTERSAREQAERIIHALYEYVDGREASIAARLESAKYDETEAEFDTYDAGVNDGLTLALRLIKGGRP